MLCLWAFCRFGSSASKGHSLFCRSTVLTDYRKSVFAGLRAITLRTCLRRTSMTSRARTSSSRCADNRRESPAEIVVVNGRRSCCSYRLVASTYNGQLVPEVNPRMDIFRLAFLEEILDKGMRNSRPFLSIGWSIVPIARLLEERDSC